MGLEGMGVKVRAALLVCLAGCSFLAGDVWAQAAVATATVDSPGRVAMLEARLVDWPQLRRYRAANAALGPAMEGDERVVFYGASMTEFWGKTEQAFFPGSPM